jgi:hypothetical protein
MSGDDVMDSLLEYILTDVCGFLLLHPFMPYVRPTLLETQRERCLSVRWKPPDTFDRGPEFIPWADERGEKVKQVVKSYPPMCKYRVEN